MKRQERNSRIALRVAAGIIAAILAALTGTACLAQDFPAKPVRMIIGFPPGGGADIVNVSSINSGKPGSMGRAACEERGGGALRCIGRAYLRQLELGLRCCRI